MLDAISERIFVIANIIIDRTVCRKHAADEQFDALKIYILYAIFSINLLSIIRSKMQLLDVDLLYPLFELQLILDALKNNTIRSCIFGVLNFIYERMLRSSSIHKLCALHKCIRPEIFEPKNLCSHYACECVSVCVCTIEYLPE